MGKNTLKIGTFNVLNLVNPNHKFYGNRHYSNKEFEQKTGWISHQLDKMKVDIVGFQEVFHEEALRQVLQKTSHLQNANLAIANPTGDAPTVALAANFPIVKQEIFTDFAEKLKIEGVEIPISKFSRPVLKVTVELKSDLRIVFFVAHLKSKRPLLEENADRDDPIEQANGAARSLVRRALEASALRSLIVQTVQGTNLPVVVMGDLNDGSLAVTTRAISGEPPMRYLPFEVKKKNWDVLLYHAKDIQARQSFHDVYYTHIHNGHYESLDHIMVSQELYDGNPNHIGRVRNVALFNDHLIDETLTEENIPVWQSDHGQVVATIEFKTDLELEIGSLKR